MPQVGDLVNYVGDGSNGTVAGVPYMGTLASVNAPSGWGPCDVTVNVAGTPTLVLGVMRDGLLEAYLGVVAQPNGTWRIVT